MGSMTRVGAVLVLLGAPVLLAQAPDGASEPTATEQTATISVRSTLVVVPALVRTKKGDLVFTLQAKDFALTDNGVAQKLRLEQDTGDEPLALVIVVEVGGDGVDKLKEYQELGPMLDAVVGAVPHKVAVVSFDSEPTVELNFTTDVDKASDALANLQPGDNQDAIFDSLTYAVDMLRKQPLVYRRAILLLSETIDHGSHTKLVDALRAIDDTNTVMYSVAFSSTRAEERGESAKFSSDEPGPQHGCFSRDPNADPKMTQSKTSQDYDCFAELLPPLRLAKMAFIAATNSLKRNVPESTAKLTGGEYFHFKNEKTLQQDLLTISNHMPNRYVLSFQPQSPVAGFHTIQLTLLDHRDLGVEARNGYWAEDVVGPDGVVEAPVVPAPVKGKKR
jgi:VWFA-related protein